MDEERSLSRIFWDAYYAADHNKTIAEVTEIALGAVFAAQQPTAWIRATLVETSTAEVGYLIKCGPNEEHPDDVPLYRRAEVQTDGRQFGKVLSEILARQPR